MSAAAEPLALDTVVPVCRIEQLVPERGVAALVGEAQVALFLIVGRVFAIDHRDPRTGANVLARGIVGTAGDRVYVASPLHKERYDLHTGECLDDDAFRVRTWGVDLRDGIVHVGAGSVETGDR